MGLAHCFTDAETLCKSVWVGMLEVLLSSMVKFLKWKTKQNYITTFLTSNVISRVFFGTWSTPVSASSPDTHTQGLAVNIEPPSFLLGMTTTWYGITAGQRKREVRRTYSGPACWVPRCLCDAAATTHWLWWRHWWSRSNRRHWKTANDRETVPSRHRSAERHSAYTASWGKRKSKWNVKRASRRHVFSCSKTLRQNGKKILQKNPCTNMTQFTLMNSLIIKCVFIFNGRLLHGEVILQLCSFIIDTNLQLSWTD